MTDLEGVAGIDNWDPLVPGPEKGADEYKNQAHGVQERLEMQRLLTGEVNAACEGLFAAGVEDILVNDAHGAKRTIIVEELIPGVKIVRGDNRPCWLPGISPRFDALVQVGMHAMSDTPGACLAHTMSLTVRAYRLNGRPVGEMELAAYLAGELGIPWIFTSGDLHACKEAEGFVPGMVVAPVKEGLSTYCAIHLTPHDARKLIRERVKEAVARAQETQPLRLSYPVTLEIERRAPGPETVGPGGERVDAFTVRWQGDNFWRLFHLAVYGKEVVPPA
jgi:D-amino peptidase